MSWPFRSLAARRGDILTLRRPSNPVRPQHDLPDGHGRLLGRHRLRRRRAARASLVGRGQGPAPAEPALVVAAGHLLLRRDALDRVLLPQHVLHRELQLARVAVLGDEGLHPAGPARIAPVLDIAGAPAAPDGAPENGRAAPSEPHRQPSRRPHVPPVVRPGLPLPAESDAGEVRQVRVLVRVRLQRPDGLVRARPARGRQHDRVLRGRGRDVEDAAPGARSQDRDDGRAPRARVDVVPVARRRGRDVAVPAGRGRGGELAPPRAQAHQSEPHADVGRGRVLALRPDHARRPHAAGVRWRRRQVRGPRRGICRLARGRRRYPGLVAGREAERRGDERRCECELGPCAHGAAAVGDEPPAERHCDLAGLGGVCAAGEGRRREREGHLGGEMGGEAGDSEVDDEAHDVMAMVMLMLMLYIYLKNTGSIQKNTYIMKYHSNRTREIFIISFYLSFFLFFSHREESITQVSHLGAGCKENPPWGTNLPSLTPTR